MEQDFINELMDKLKKNNLKYSEKEVKLFIKIIFQEIFIYCFLKEKKIRIKNFGKFEIKEYFFRKNLTNKKITLKKRLVFKMSRNLSKIVGKYLETLKERF